MALDRHWQERLGGGQFPNGVILSGDEREALSRELAQSYLCGADQPPCGVCRHCRKVKAGIHPDLVYAKDADSVKVSGIRALRSDAYVRPNEADRKVYVCAADQMNVSAQNALLKLLEEGPAYASFFFLTDNPERLLPTLRSRCECLRGMEGAPSFQAETEAFLSLLLEDAPLALLHHCVALEKRSRGEIAQLLDETMEGLVARMATDGVQEKHMALIQRLRPVREACEFNISGGHLSGMLLAGLL